MKKNNEVCLVAHTSLKAMDNCFWYLNNTWLRHMSGDNNLLKEIELINGDTLTFRDGSKSIVEEKGSIKICRISVLQNVLIVNGLKTNLLSIS